MTELLRSVSERGGRTARVPSLRRADVDRVWTEVSSYIELQMTSQKGVHVSGLGTFMFSQQVLNVGGKPKKTQQPVFILAGKLVQSLGLKQTRLVAAASRLPVVQLNFAAVSQQTPFSRDVVERCVSETLVALYRALASKKNVSLTFKGIGVLSFKHNKVLMKFSRDFIDAVCGTESLRTGSDPRARSGVSLLSGALSKLQRSQTASPVTLPTVCSPRPENKAGGKNREGLSLSPDRRNAGEVPQQSDSNSNQAQQTKAVGRDIEELNPTPPMEAAHNSKLDQHPGYVSCSGHSRSEQELCYLCVQRRLRNVPVKQGQQQQGEEKTEEKLLLLREQIRDKQDAEKELAKLREQREQAKQVAAFNLQTSEKKEKTACVDYPSGFIFPARPVTPSRRIQQHCYMNELQSQMERRRKHEAEDQQSRLLLERRHQIQMIQEIALLRAHQFQQKQEKTKNYKKALDTQVEDKKHMETPKCQPENSRLNRCETAVINAESRERAQKLFQVNFSVATQKKKEEQQNRQQQLEKEKEMLEHNKMKLMLDRIHHFEMKHDVQKSLEDEWSRSLKLKQKREDEERLFLRSAGQLLVDKIEEYSRCSQCKRRTTNCGESNIWKDSRFLSGSQFMI